MPAHNEAQVIGRCLEALLTWAESDEFDVIVVANGCTDGTAEIARRYSPRVRVMEIETASKSNALNVGDRAARSFPRIYLDADVEFTTQDLRYLVAALDTGSVLAAAPEIHLDLSNCVRGVRSYMAIWEALPVIQDGLVGRGVYALSADGRSRFGEFPDLIADDLFIHSRFTESEKTCVKGCRSVVRAPRTVRDLIRQKSRVQVGIQQLRQADRSVKSTRSAWISLPLSRPRLLPSLPTYIMISLIIRLYGGARRLGGRQTRWLRDEGARWSEQPALGERAPSDCTTRRH